MGGISGPGGNSAASGSYTGDVTGFTVPIQVTIFWLKVGSLVTLLIPAFTGTSNATSLTITGAPASIRPITNPAGSVVCFPMLSNGSQVTGEVFMDVNGVLQFRRDNSLVAWSSMGTKALDAVPMQYTYSQVNS